MLNVRKLTGELIGNYELRELYGVGGMGAVYRAFQRNLERDVAFKVMSLAYAEDADFIKRFYREAKLAASLEHPNIVPVYDYGGDAGLQYVVMRLLTGGSLAERMIQRQGVRPAMSEISVVLKQLASALDYAHSQRIIHRDVKSNNVMFDTHGTAYLVDFGIARLAQDNATRLTADGTTIGTPTHMAPEQWLGEEASAASDQYAVAIVIYELLTGTLPFQGPTIYAIMTKHMSEPLPAIQQFDPLLPASIMPILQRALAKDKTKRYPTITAFAQAFEEMVARNPGISTDLFTFTLRRDLLHTDSFPDKAPPTQPPQHTAPQPRLAQLTPVLTPLPAAPQPLRPLQPLNRPAPRPANPPQRSVPPVKQAANPRRAMPVPERIMVEVAAQTRQGDANFLLLPVYFVGKVLKGLLWVAAFILRQAIKSTIAFLVTLLLSTVMFLLVGWFTLTLFNTNFDFATALELMKTQALDMLQGR